MSASRVASLAVACLLLSCSAGGVDASGTSSPAGQGGNAQGTGGEAQETGSGAQGTGGAGGRSDTGAGGAGGRAAGGMATGGGQTSGVGGAEPGCADPNAGVGWAGDWGQMLTHGCIESPGLPDPVTFDISDAGHDCETITADVWVPGITDADADPALIRAQVWTDVGSASPPLKEASALHFVRRVGNNYRYSWAPYLPVVSPGDYELWFRFSVGDENQGCWYLIGTGEGPGGGAARTAHVVP